MRHYREDDSSAARRARPRCFTSVARSRIDCCVMTRPSLRAIEAFASSSVARNSARLRSRSSHSDNASSTASSARPNRPASMARRTKLPDRELSALPSLFSVRAEEPGVKHLGSIAHVCLTGTTPPTPSASPPPRPAPLPPACAERTHTSRRTSTAQRCAPSAHQWTSRR